MHIKLHEPVRSARQLRLPWNLTGSIIWAITWMWIRKKIYERVNRCGTTFNPTTDRFVVIFNGKGRFGYYSWNIQWHEMASVPLSFSEIKSRLRSIRASFITCQDHTTILSCGCESTFVWLTQDAPFEDGQEQCQDCGKYHRGGKLEDDVYRDCAEHKRFFERWPDANRGHYLTGDCPQIRGLTPHGAYRILSERLEQGPMERNRQKDLCQAISKMNTIAADALELVGLDQDLRDWLAMSVKQAWQARNILEKCRDGRISLGPRAIRHLRRMVLAWRTSVWVVRTAIASFVLVAWLWHLPDWQTIVVLAATAACAWIAIKIKEWLE